MTQCGGAPRSRDKTPMAKRQHPNPNTNNALPNSKTPNTKIGGISYIGVLSVVLRTANHTYQIIVLD